MKEYYFDEELIQGLIKSRPNRFIMLVEIKGKIEKCHCPSTGRIGNILFENIPCLLSKSTSKIRKTKYTVEAISPVVGKWVGINQTKANSYINFFLKNNLLKKIPYILPNTMPLLSYTSRNTSYSFFSTFSNFFFFQFFQL